MIKPLLALANLRPPVRRVAAIDPGQRRLKVLQVESTFGRLRITSEELTDLTREGLVSQEEVKNHLQAALSKWGSPGVALVLPQHISISQVIDLPLAPESEVKKLIEDETVRLSGVSESRIVYDFAAIGEPAKNRQRFWVTLSQEGEIRQRIQRLGLENEDLCEVITTADALIAAHRALFPHSSRAILVHMGAQTTVVIALLDGHGAFATSFQMGSDFLTRALARVRNISEEAADELKAKTNLFNGPDADPEFIEAVDGWHAELNRQLKDWGEQNPGMAFDLAAFELLASGGGFEQPGLLEFLKKRGYANLQPWPSSTSNATVRPSKGFEVAYGAALQALGHSPEPVSLLPVDYRASWQKRLTRQVLEFASYLLILLCILLFAGATWHNALLLKTKQSLLEKVKAGQEMFDENASLTESLVSDYEALRPFFAAQQNTLDTLKTLALLQQSRSNRTGWYVLLADQNSYFSQPAGFTATNAPAKTNVTATTAVGTNSFTSLFGPSPFAFTNLSPAKPGLIAEMCIPGDSEPARRLLSQMVVELQQQHSLFSKVDLLPDDLRRALADPKVVVPDRHFAVSLDFAETDFQKTTPTRRGAGGAPGRGTRRAPRNPPATSDSAENLSQSFR